MARLGRALIGLALAWGAHSTIDDAQQAPLVRLQALLQALAEADATPSMERSAASQRQEQMRLAARQGANGPQGRRAL